MTSFEPLYPDVKKKLTNNERENHQNKKPSRIHQYSHSASKLKKKKKKSGLLLIHEYATVLLFEDFKDDSVSAV